MQHLRAAPIFWSSFAAKIKSGHMTYTFDSQELLDIEKDLDWMKAGLNLVKSRLVILMFWWKPVQQPTTLPGTNQSTYGNGHTLGNVVAFPCPLPGEKFQSPRSKTAYVITQDGQKEAMRTTKPCEPLHAHAEDSACGRGSRERVAAHRYTPRFKDTSFRIRNGLTDESLPS